MNDKDLLNSIVDDLQKSPAKTVIYLEGKTDVDIFFSLLGYSRPPGDIHQNVLIRGLQEGFGSGSEAVCRRVELASAKFSNGGRFFGILDGDGVMLDDLKKKFDAPFPGPLFYWKAYCIENLLQKTGWPSIWAAAPDWKKVFRDYAPYVALNRVHRNFTQILNKLNIAHYINPVAGQPLLKASSISKKLKQGKNEILQRDVQQDFRNEVASFEKALNQGVDAAHCLLNGKWAISHLAVTKTRKSSDECRKEWIKHAIAQGGVPEVKDWWARIIGRKP